MGSVKSALTPQPTVIPADDPIRLSTPTTGVGPDLHYQAACLYEGQGNATAAARHYQKALEVQPDDIRSIISYARLCDRQRDFQRADTLYRRALELQPDNTTALNDAGMCYARFGQLQTSVPLLERAVHNQPDNKLYRNNLATVLVEADRVDEAYQHLCAAHGEAVAHYNLGYLLSRKNATERARHHLARALEIDPTLVPAQALLARLDRQFDAISRGDRPRTVPPVRPQPGSSQFGSRPPSLRNAARPTSLRTLPPI
jgi:Tfp pilus assembly protein PilF